jgi:DNA-binding response OmpR family regulator
VLVVQNGDQTAGWGASPTSCNSGPQMTVSEYQPTVFVLNRDDAVRANCERILSDIGYRVVALDAGYAELDPMMETGPAAVIADLRQPCDECCELIHEVRMGHRNAAIIVIAARPSVRNAVDALKAGADEILSEPFSSDELRATVAVALRKHSDETS